VLASELILGAHVEDHQSLVVEPACQLRSRRDRVEARLERRLHRVQLHLADLQLVRPPRNPAAQHCDARMTGELRHLHGRHGADTVAAVIEHESLVTRHSVTAKPQPDLGCECLQHLRVAHGRRRSEHERPRARNVPARVRVRPAHVAEEEIIGSELGLEPGDVDDRGQVRHLAGIRLAAR
jgi:hypothetical protein